MQLGAIKECFRSGPIILRRGLSSLMVGSDQGHRHRTDRGWWSCSPLITALMLQILKRFDRPSLSVFPTCILAIVCDVGRPREPDVAGSACITGYVLLVFKCFDWLLPKPLCVLVDYDRVRGGVSCVRGYGSSLWTTDSPTHLSLLVVGRMTRTPESGADNLYRGQGAGSNEVDSGLAGDDAGPNDGRYDTRTTFYYSYGRSPSWSELRSRHQLHRRPEDRRSWKQLAEKNDGVGEPSRKQDNFEADVRRWVDTFTSQVGLNEYHTGRVEYLIADILDDPEKELWHGDLSAEWLIAGAMSLVHDADITDPDNFDRRLSQRSEFQCLMDDLGMGHTDLRLARKIAHRKTELFDDT
jgi:hypothetical protein